MLLLERLLAEEEWQVSAKAALIACEVPPSTCCPAAAHAWASEMALRVLLLLTGL